MGALASCIATSISLLAVLISTSLAGFATHASSSLRLAFVQPLLSVPFPRFLRTESFDIITLYLKTRLCFLNFIVCPSSIAPSAPSLFEFVISPLGVGYRPHISSFAFGAAMPPSTLNCQPLNLSTSLTYRCLMRTTPTSPSRSRRMLRSEYRRLSCSYTIFSSRSPSPNVLPS